MGKYFWVKTSAVSGTFSTSFFGEPFNETNFDIIMSFALTVAMPEYIRNRTDIMLVVNIDYDIGEKSNTERVKLNGSEILDKKYKHTARNLSVSEDLLGKATF